MYSLLQVIGICPTTWGPITYLQVEKVGILLLTWTADKRITWSKVFYFVRYFSLTLHLTLRLDDCQALEWETSFLVQRSLIWCSGGISPAMTLTQIPSHKRWTRRKLTRRCLFTRVKIFPTCPTTGVSQRNNFWCLSFCLSHNSRHFYRLEWALQRVGELKVSSVNSAVVQTFLTPHRA